MPDASNDHTHVKRDSEITGTCRVCHQRDTILRHLELYVFGSEGLWLCHICEMALVEYVRVMASVASRAKMAFVRQRLEK